MNNSNSEQSSLAIGIEIFDFLGNLLEIKSVPEHLVDLDDQLVL